MTTIISKDEDAANPASQDGTQTQGIPGPTLSIPDPEVANKGSRPTLTILTFSNLPSSTSPLTPVDDEIYVQNICITVSTCQRLANLDSASGIEDTSSKFNIDIDNNTPFKLREKDIATNADTEVAIKYTVHEGKRGIIQPQSVQSLKLTTKNSYDELHCIARYVICEEPPIIGRECCLEVTASLSRSGDPLCTSELTPKRVALDGKRRLCSNQKPYTVKPPTTTAKKNRRKRYDFSYVVGLNAKK